MDKHGGVHSIATWRSCYVLIYNPLEGLFLFVLFFLFLKKRNEEDSALCDCLGLKGETEWWSREDESLDPLHEEVYDGLGFCSDSLGLGEWSQKIISTGECLIQVVLCNGENGTI